MTQGYDLARLADDSRWLRVLARSLVADAHLADDLAQDALVAALERRGADHDRPVGAWRAFFATSLRRRLFERRREGASRGARERAAARHEALPSTLEMLERASVQRDLVQAVLELDEPYRTAVLWRFFEELPPREIARRSLVPVATVHTRIQRGLERLRGRLAREHGERSWAVALAPLLSAPPAPHGAAPLLHALLVKQSTQLVLLALVLAAGALVAWRVQRPAPEPAVAAAPARVDPPGAPARVADAARPTVREPVAEGAAPPAAAPKPADAPAPAGAARRVAGVALDAHGRGVAGAELVARPDGTRFRSGGGGRFELELAPGARSIESDDARFATVLAGSAETTAEAGAVVVLAPRLALAGRVLDESGTPLAGAELRVHLPAGLGAAFGVALDGALRREWAAVSGADGAFALEGVPWVEGARLSARLGGFEPLDEPLPAESSAGLEIVLRRPRAVPGLVRGVVLRPDGSAAAGARIALGLATTVADADGRFALAALEGEAPQRVLALLRGFLPAAATLEKHGGAWPAELVLRLGGEPLSIEGRVVRADGAPVPGARVWLAEPTWFGGVEGDVVSAESLVGPDDRRFWAFAEAGADGGFELTGLAPRDYALRAVDPTSLLLVEATAAAGARGVRLELPADAVHPRVRGRVVAADGSGVPGVAVTVQRMALEYAYPGGGTRDSFATRPAVTTDAAGRFELADVPREGVELFAHGDAILFAGVWLRGGEDPDDVTIRVERRVHVQVELDPPFERADSLRVLDGEEKGLVLRIMRGSTSETNPVARIEEGRSHVLSLSERARWVVLYRGEAEVARLALEPAPSGVNTVRW